MKPEDDMNRESIQDSVTRLFDGDLSEEGFAELSRELSENPAAREAYLEAARLEVSLDHYFAPALGRAAKGSASFSSSARAQAKWSLGIAAAAVLVLGAVLWALRGADRTGGPVTFQVCGNSEWVIEGAKSPQGDHLVPGSVFRIEKGVVELRLPSGIRAVVEAPAALSLIDSESLRLDYGRAFFRVASAEGRGFTLVTPRQRIVDLGTAFGIESRGDPGQLELHVLEGEVRVDGLDGTHGETLRAGRSVLLDGKTVKREIGVSAAGFLRDLPEKVEMIFREDFESGPVAGRGYSVQMDPTVVRGFGGDRFEGMRDDAWNFSTVQPPGVLVRPVTYAYGNVKPSDRMSGKTNEFLFRDPALEKLTDGEKGDPAGWATGSFVGFEDAPAPVGITFDFGSGRRLTEAVLHSCKSFGGLPLSARLSVSLDGVVFSPATGSGLPLRWEAEEGSRMVARLDISGWPPARYYRFDFQSAGQWMFLGEMGFREMNAESETLETREVITPSASTAGDSPPVIMERHPANGAQGVAAGSALRLVFDKPISLGTGRVLIRNLKDGTEAEVAVGSARLIAEGTVLTIIPPAGLEDLATAQGRISGWKCALPVALMNPAGDGTFYHGEGFSDRKRTRGMVGAMRGPTMATFTAGFPGAGISREIGKIAPNRRYNVSLAIGCRPLDGPDFLGYSVRLKAGETVLAELSGEQPPGPPDSVGTVAFSWDSSELPEGVAQGDRLSLEIAPASRFASGYLDIDNIQVTSAAE